jgi:C1A family cysteine protease
MPSFGWIPDKKDKRDFTLKTHAPGLLKVKEVCKLPASVDLRDGCPPIRNQGNVGSCTAFAATGMFEFFMKRVGEGNSLGQPAGQYTKMSELFLYFATRLIRRDVETDSGAMLRETLEAMVRFGGVPEKDWPYVEGRFAMAPAICDSRGNVLPGGEAAIWASAQGFRTTRYIRLDPDGASKEEILADIKTAVYSNMPVVFGSLVYGQIFSVGSRGDIAMPKRGEECVGGHAMLIVGYDDAHVNLDGSKGAFIIRNSWGSGWGMGGYGYLPYNYLYDGLASDFWTLQNAEWINTGLFY